MNVTPLDLRQQKFKSAMRGYDRGEVDALLTEVADDYEGAIREADRLRQEVARLEDLLAEHRSEEKSLKNTLVSAQRLADEMRETAERDAQRVMRDAEARADLLVQKAQSRHEDLQREIDGLRARRRETSSVVPPSSVRIRRPSPVDSALRTARTLTIDWRLDCTKADAPASCSTSCCRVPP